MAASVHQSILSFGHAKSAHKEERNRCRIPTSSKDLLWKEFFRDPSMWWDNRSNKSSPGYPDFKHRLTRQPLWVHSRDTPLWVMEELRGLDPFHERSQIDEFWASLRACARDKDLATGSSIHHDIMQRGLLRQCSHPLVIMYAKCGELEKARELLFSHKSCANVVTWTALIAGYAQAGHGLDALDCFEQMQHEGILPDAVTYACVLKACTIARAADKGKQIHDEIARQGLLQGDIVLGNALMDMYAKCGAVSMAQQVFDGLASRDVISWSTLITGYTQGGHAQQALNCFEEMRRDGIVPEAVTYACILKACATIGAADKGHRIHDEIAKHGVLENNVVLGNAVIDMYSKCGNLSKARQVLNGMVSRDVVSWSALIAGYAQQGRAKQALNCFEEMQREGVLPNAVTYACVLKACATIRAADKGEQIHDEISKQGLLQKSNSALGNALLDMYAKCGALAKAREVLEGLRSRNVVSWNTLIAGYVQEGHGREALNSFEEMQCEGVLPDAVTYACILKACAMIGAAEKGKRIHDELVRQGLLQDNVVLGNALVDMYAKCGALPKARQVLDWLPCRDVVSWNALIAGYAREGLAKEALSCFKEMEEDSILPNMVTCSCVLNVCSHRGLLEEGQAVFVKMSDRYGVNPSVECYVCMVDLLGRTGHVEKAARLIEGMPSSDHSIIWHTLLGACWKWADVNVGRWAFEQVVCQDKSDGPAYVIMANIYAVAGMVQKAENIEAMRIMNRAWKKPWCSL